MDDLISRQEAITAIQEAYADTEGGADKCAVWKNVGLTNALHIMQDLPSAQPYTDAEIQKIQDLEQAEMQKAYECGRASAQPEIIRCKDCEHWDKTWTNDWAEGYHYCPMVDGVRKVDFYCADAERQEE